MKNLASNSRVGLISPAIDVHRIGIVRLARLLGDCGIFVSVASLKVREAAGNPLTGEGFGPVVEWIKSEGLDVLGFSYRLDPQDAVRLFGAFMAGLEHAGLMEQQGGRVRSVYFAGLPPACALVGTRYPSIAGVFSGTEEPEHTLTALGVPTEIIPASLRSSSPYDEWRLGFGKELICKGDYLGVQPVDRSGSRFFGLRGDGIASRIAHGRQHSLPPLMRAHAGPYLPDRLEAVRVFGLWAGELARGGLLDVLSIGSSQLTQSDFGRDWAGLPNGGGVPIRTREEYERIWQLARPMLVRTYAGTRKVPDLARLHEESLDIAWHALSLWWFSLLDGRGPNGVRENLNEHVETLRYIAGTGKPFEPNVPHHFAFRGADDLSCVIAGYLAVRAARSAGVRRLVLQTMLNTPRGSWGVQDIAKARVLLQLVRGIPGLEVYLQPRGGLDHFSSDQNLAKAQLAAVSALMDDIEPEDDSSPGLIHVVAYSEGQGLADPPVIEESIRITRYALTEYRRLKKKGLAPDVTRDDEVLSRTANLAKDARLLISAFESTHPAPWSAEGLYDALACGLLVAPELAACREEFPAAVQVQAELFKGSVVLVDDESKPVKAAARAEAVKAALSGRIGSKKGKGGR